MEPEESNILITGHVLDNHRREMRMTYDSDWSYDDDPVWIDRTGPHFKDDISEMREKHGVPCDFVSVPFIYVDYRALEEDQLNYYLYWRDSFWEGNMLRTCEGYLWILANEIALSDYDPVKTYSLLMELWEMRNADLFDPSLFREFIRDYAIEHNLPQPPSEEFNSDKNEVLVNLISCCPPWYMDGKMLSEMTNGIGIMRNEADVLCRIVDVSLRRLDRMLRKDGGSLIDTYSSNNLENIHDLYRGYSLLRGRKVSVDSPDLFHNGDFRLLVRNMSRYASSLIRGLKVLDRPNDLSEIIIEIITDTFENMDDSAPDYIPSDTATVIKPVSDRYIGKGLHPSLDKDVPARETNKVATMIERNTIIRSSSAQRLLSNWKNNTDSPSRYVPSGYVNPSYDSFDGRQLKYYIYWRSQIRNGKYLETDNGYIRLLIAEIISCSDDPKDAVMMMDGIMRTYADPAIGRFIKTAIQEYSLIYGLPIEDTEGASEPVLNGIALLNMSRTPMGHLSSDVLASISGVDRTFIDKLGKEGLAAINESLRMIDEERVALGIPKAIDFYNVQKTFQNAFYTIRRDFPVPSYNNTYPTFTVNRNSSFRVYVSNTIKLVSLFMERYTGRKIKIPVPNYHGERTLKIIETSVLKSFGIEPGKKKKFELDKDALKSAQDDLAAVTEMMGSDESAEKEIIEDTEEKETGWDALAKALDDHQIRYLAEALDDGSRCASIAESSNKTVMKMEDSINSLSMDIVGDTIVENQSVVEDYYDDVRAIVEAFQADSDSK